MEKSAKTEEIIQEKLDSILQRHGYKLIDKLGQGGFASCWKVERIDVMQPFAVKVIQMKGDSGSGKGFDAYYSEIDTIIHLTHSNIIHCYSYFCEENILFLVLDFCPGGSLDDIIRSKRLLHNSKVLEFTYSLLQALNYMHSKNIAHLDIKPSNILIDAYGRVKFADFGLAQFVCGNRTDKYYGSLAFMSPEIHSQKPYDPFKADVWSFGVTLYYLAFRQLPWLANNKRDYEQLMKMGCLQIPVSAHPTIKKIILRCIVLNPEERASVPELIQIVNKTVDEGVIANKQTNTQKSQVQFNLSRNPSHKINPRARFSLSLSKPLKIAKSQVVLPVLKQAST